MMRWATIVATTLRPGQWGNLWWLVIAVVTSRCLVVRAVRSIGELPPGSVQQVALAAVAATLPGVAFVVLSSSMLHVMNPWRAGSIACLVHCSVLLLALTCVLGYAAARTAWHARGVARLVRTAGDPSHRLHRIAENVAVPVRQLPTESLVLATAGFWDPLVLVSDGVLARLTDEELRAALLHERAHLHRRETVRTAVTAFLGDCTPAPVPAAFELYCSAREHAADRDAVRNADPLILAHALVSLTRSDRLAPRIVTFAGSRGIRARVDALLRDGAGGDRRRPLLAATLLTAAGCAASLPTVIRLVLACRPS